MPKSLQIGPNPSLITIGGTGVLSLNALTGHVSLAVGATNGLSLNVTGPVVTLDLPQNLNTTGSPIFAGTVLGSLSVGAQTAVVMSKGAFDNITDYSPVIGLLGPDATSAQIVQNHFHPWGVAYNPTGTYSAGEYCTYSGLKYKSIQSLNSGNQPDISPLWWSAVTWLTSFHSEAALTGAVVIPATSTNSETDAVRAMVVCQGPTGGVAGRFEAIGAGTGASPWCINTYLVDYDWEDPSQNFAVTGQAIEMDMHIANPASNMAQINMNVEWKCDPSTRAGGHPLCLGLSMIGQPGAPYESFFDAGLYVFDYSANIALHAGKRCHLFAGGSESQVIEFYSGSSTTLISQMWVDGSGNFVFDPAVSGVLTTISPTGVVSAASFSGAGTGLTGTASSLSIGGNSATATLAADSSKLDGQLPGYYINTAGGQTISGNLTATAFYGDGSHLTGVASTYNANLSYGGTVQTITRNISAYVADAISIADFGVVSGSTADQGALVQVAFNTSASLGKALKIPAGYFIYIGQQITIPAGLQVIGDGYEVCGFYRYSLWSAADSPRRAMFLFPTGANNVVLYGFFVDSRIGTTGYTIGSALAATTRIDYATYGDPYADQFTDYTSFWIANGVSNIWFEEVNIRRTGGFMVFGYAAYSLNIDDVTFYHCAFNDNRPATAGFSGDENYGTWNSGILFENDGTTAFCQNIRVQDCSFYRMAGTCFWTHSQSLSTIHNTVASATWSSGIATYAIAGTHSVSIGNIVSVSSASPVAWNGNGIVSAVLISGGYTYVSFAMPTAPPTWTSGGVIVTTDTTHWNRGLIFTGNYGEDIALDFTQPTCIDGYTETNNTIRRLGYLVLDDTGSTRKARWDVTPVAFDSGENINSIQANNRILAANGEGYDKDGDAKSTVTGNEYESAWASSDPLINPSTCGYPGYHQNNVNIAVFANCGSTFKVAGCNYDVTFTDNLIRSAGAGAFRLYGSQRYRVSDNLIFCDSTQVAQPIQIGNLPADSYGPALHGSDNDIDSNTIHWSNSNGSGITEVPNGEPFLPTDVNRIGINNKFIGCQGYYKDPKSGSTTGYLGLTSVSNPANFYEMRMQTEGHLGTGVDAALSFYRNVPPQGWYPSWGVPLNLAILDSNGHIQMVTTAGTTGSGSHPAWNSSGGTTYDNGVVWQDEGLPPSNNWAGTLSVATAALPSLTIGSYGTIDSARNFTGNSFTTSSGSILVIDNAANLASNSLTITNSTLPASGGPTIYLKATCAGGNGITAINSYTGAIYGQTVPNAQYYVLDDGHYSGHHIFATSPYGGPFNSTPVERFRITDTGRLGVGTSLPVDLISNTTTNVTDTLFHGCTGGQGIAIISSASGYSGSLYNASFATAANGLLIGLANSAATNRILTLNVGGVGGTDVFYVQGNGAATFGTLSFGSVVTINGSLTVTGSFSAGSMSFTDLAASGQLTVGNSKQTIGQPSYIMEIGGSFGWTLNLTQTNSSLTDGPGLAYTKAIATGQSIPPGNYNWREGFDHGANIVAWTIRPGAGFGPNYLSIDYFSGAVALYSSLSVGTGGISTAGSLGVAGTLNVTGGLIATGGITIPGAGSITVGSGASSFAGSLGVGGNLSSSSNISASGYVASITGFYCNGSPVINSSGVFVGAGGISTPGGCSVGSVLVSTSPYNAIDSSGASFATLTIAGLQVVTGGNIITGKGYNVYAFNTATSAWQTFVGTTGFFSVVAGVMTFTSGFTPPSGHGLQVVGGQVIGSF